ncbi:hypothetical protein EVAR_65049_1 [Eumeta japonica]|uniref:Uncharacterized protein n=1 Tax=Eumeta variegata TaxID=151549 RepID=A0A4C1ZRM7_EUMVA|nr:hypothetical protein EVAR_65049_1 [Eumeta japonica]
MNDSERSHVPSLPTFKQASPRPALRANTRQIFVRLRLLRISSRLRLDIFFSAIARAERTVISLRVGVVGARAGWRTPPRLYDHSDTAGWMT